MIFESSRLRFREMTPDDFPTLAEMLQNEAVMYAWEHTFSDDEVRGWIERNLARYREHGCGYWLAFLKSTGEPVGQIGLMPEEIKGKSHLGVGWILRQSCFHQGYAAEGGQAALDYAFRVLGALRVVADIRPENVSSLRVAERLGMMPCGEYDKIVGDKIMRHNIYYARTPRIVVTDFDPQWARDFAALQIFLAPVLDRFGGTLEHVGSTSVPGLAAKPVIDADYLLPAAGAWRGVKEALASLGFHHRGDGGLPGREMFTESLQLEFRHNFYVCFPGSPHLANHLKLRDYLRSHPGEAARYGALKQELAREFPGDVDSYCAGKSDLISEFLAVIGFDGGAVREINRINKNINAVSGNSGASRGSGRGTDG